jgi:hypothetical protein
MTESKHVQDWRRLLLQQQSKGSNEHEHTVVVLCVKRPDCRGCIKFTHPNGEWQQIRERLSQRPDGLLVAECDVSELPAELRPFAPRVPEILLLRRPTQQQQQEPGSHAQQEGEPVVTDVQLSTESKDMTPLYVQSVDHIFDVDRTIRTIEVFRRAAAQHAGLTRKQHEPIMTYSFVSTLHHHFISTRLLSNVWRLFTG